MSSIINTSDISDLSPTMQTIVAKYFEPKEKKIPIVKVNIIQILREENSNLSVIQICVAYFRRFGCDITPKQVKSILTRAINKKDSSGIRKFAGGLYGLDHAMPV